MTEFIVRRLPIDVATKARICYVPDLVAQLDYGRVSAQSNPQVLGRRKKTVESPG
jgi:hypothetical protein